MNRRLLSLLILSLLLPVLFSNPLFSQLLNLERIVQAGEASPLPATMLRLMGLSNTPVPETGRALPRRIPRTAFAAADGRVYFLGFVQDSFRRAGIFVHDSEGVRPVILAGRPLPNFNLGMFSGFKELNPAADGGLVFTATLSGPPVREGVFLYQRGNIRPIVLQNDPVPGSAADTFRSFRIPLNPVPQAVPFLATLNRPGNAQGIYLWSNGQMKTLVGTGGSIPDYAGTHYESIEDLSVGPDRTLAYSALLAGGQYGAGVFSIDSNLEFLDGPVRAVLLAGGGPFDPGSIFSDFGLVSVMGRDRYAFSGRLNSGLDGIFLWLSGSLRTLSREGNTMPGMPDRSFAAYDSLDTNEQGDALFRGVAAASRPDTAEPQGLFLYEAASRLVLAVAHSDSTVPGMGGRRIVSLSSTFLGAASKGIFTAAFDANLLDGVMPLRREPDGAICTFNSDRPAAVAFTGMPSGVEGPTGIETINGFSRPGTDGAAYSLGSLGSRNGLLLARGRETVRLFAEGQESTPRSTGEFEEFGRVYADDSGRIAFAARLRGGDSAGGIFRLANNTLSPVILLNHPLPGGAGERISRISAFSSDRSGNLALSGVIENAGRATRAVLAQDFESTLVIAQEGQVAPGSQGQRFQKFYQVANSGRAYVAFVARSVFSSAQPGEDVSLYLSSGGAVKVVASAGELVPGLSITVFREFRELSLDRRGRLLFTADISRRERPDVNRRTALFLYDGLRMELLLGSPETATAAQEVISDPRFPQFLETGDFTLQASVGGARAIVLQQGGRYSPIYIEGKTAPGLDGRPLGLLMPLPVYVSADGGFLFSALLEDRQALFFSSTAVRLQVPNPGFERLAFNGLPEGWETFWTNGGKGQAYQEDSLGRYAQEGNSTLRIHAGPGGGSAFVLSSPVVVEADRVYEITAQMRFALAGRSDEVYFSVLEYDAKGSVVAEHHSIGRAGDNNWQWQARAQRFATGRQTRAVRLRFGLNIREEAYLDVDGLR